MGLALRCVVCMKNGENYELLLICMYAGVRRVHNSYRHKLWTFIFFILVSNSFLYFILFGAFIFFLAFLLRANCIELWGIVTNLSYLPSYRPLSQSFSTSNVINNGVRNCFLLLLNYYFTFDEKWASKVIVFDTLHTAHSSINSKTPCECVRLYRRVDRSNVYSNL